jgi:hypothetical protein
MRKMALIVAGLGASFWLALPGPVKAADLAPEPRAAGRIVQCGPCGCLRVTFDYHRELGSTYGSGFDPRNYDETEPHYYFGPVRAYPRYTTDGDSTTDGRCPPPG